MKKTLWYRAKAACIAERYLRRLRASLRSECVSVRYFYSAEGIRTLGQLTKGEKSLVPWKTRTVPGKVNVASV